MTVERAGAGDQAGATVDRAATLGDVLRGAGMFVVECLGPDGRLKWRDTIKNLWTTVGKNDVLDHYLGNTAAGAIYMGLKGSGTAVVGDTQASHSGWTERGGANAPLYTGNRPSPTWNAAGSGSKATASAVSFAIVTTGGNVDGCFINVGGSATKDDTTGVLFSAGDFTGGAKTVAPGDTLNVTYTATLT